MSLLQKKFNQKELKQRMKVAEIESAGEKKKKEESYQAFALTLKKQNKKQWTQLGYSVHWLYC